MAADVKQQPRKEKTFNVTEVDFKGWFRRNHRVDRVFAGSSNSTTALNYEFKQDVVFGFSFVLELPTFPRPPRVAQEKLAIPSLPALAGLAPIKGLDLDDGEEEEEEDEPPAAEEKKAATEPEITFSKKEKRLAAGRLSKEAERLVETFLRNIKSIKLRYLNIPEPPPYWTQRRTPDSSDPFFSCIDGLYLELLQHHRLLKQTSGHVIIRISELFFPPDTPLLPKITSAGLFLTATFHEPVHSLLAISCLDIDPTRIYHHVPQSKYGEQQRLIPELLKSQHNLGTDWHVSFTQPLRLFSTWMYPLVTMNEITIPNAFNDRTEYLIISLEDERNDASKGHFVLHDLHSVTVKHHGITKRYMPNSYRKAENCYLNGYKLSFQKRMLMRQTLNEVLYVAELSALTLEYVDAYNAKDLMQFLILPHGKGAAPAGSNSVTFRFYKVVKQLKAHILKVGTSKVEYRPKIEREVSTSSDDDKPPRPLREVVSAAEHPFTVLHEVKKKVGADGTVSLSKRYRVYRPQTRCHLI